MTNITASTQQEHETLIELQQAVQTWYNGIVTASEYQDGRVLDTFLGENCTPDFCTIDPTGKHVTGDLYREMAASKNTSWIAYNILNFDKTTLLGGGTKAALLIFDAEEKYIHNGDVVHDVAKHTWIMEKIDGKWRLKHDHRSVGKPVMSTVVAADGN
jgi:ketosteroid isomerase-like protein